MHELDRPVEAIIDMARAIGRSNKVGLTGSKAEAEGVVRSLIGPADLAFTQRHGLNYWNYLKALLSDYVASRGLEGRYVVKGTPFNWHSAVGTKCGAVVLRKEFFRGDQRVEPEMYLEVGLLAGPQGALAPGVACGFHYLPSAEGDRSHFIKGVLSSAELRGMAWDLSNDGFVNPSYRSGGPSRFWTVDAALYRWWGEGSLPSDLRGEVFRAFDELFPLYQGITALRAP